MSNEVWFEGVDLTAETATLTLTEEERDQYMRDFAEGIGAAKPFPRLYVRMVQSKHKPMKHKITVVVCLALIVGGGSYAGKLHHQYVQQQTKVTESVQAAQTKADQAAAEKQAQFQSDLQLDEAQCRQDKTAYASLAPAVRKTAVAPNCKD